jgi:hypothetical protein
MFPVGLGLKSCLEVHSHCFDFRIIVACFGAFAKKGMWSVLFFVLAICFFAKAHSESGYEYGKPNPTVYCISTTPQAKPIGQPMTKSRFVDERLIGENKRCCGFK